MKEEKKMEAEIETEVSVDLPFLLSQPYKETPTVGARIRINVPRNRQVQSFPWFIL